jgi:hypothetical protein
MGGKDMKQRNARRFLGALTLAGVMTVGNYAFTASNTVEASAAGQGSETISGYSVSTVRYTLETSSGTANVSGVSFSIAPTSGGSAPTTVRARLSGSAAYSNCSNSTGTTWTCSFSGVTALSAASLDVAAAQ